MYYEEVKQFLKGKDPQFLEELENIILDENIQNLPKISQNVQQQQNKDFLIQKYRQTDAYKRLLKRQGQAVRRIERIKENFEKKRMQVSMLSVNHKGATTQSHIKSEYEESRSSQIGMINNSYGILGLRQQHQLNNSVIVGGGDSTKMRNKSLLNPSQNRDIDLVQYEEDVTGMTEDQLQLALTQQNTRPRTQGRTGTGLKSLLSSQTPLSYQVIMEERSSIASQQATQEKSRMDLRIHFAKMKGLNKSENLNLNLSQIYDSSTNFSNGFPLTRQSPNSRAQASYEMSYLTGVNTYKNEIFKNKTSQKQEQRAFYQPSLNQQQLYNGQRKQQIDNNFQAPISVLSQGFDSTNSSKLNQMKINIETNRPQTTSNVQGKKLVHENSQELNFSNYESKFQRNMGSGSKIKPNKPNIQDFNSSNPKRNNLLGKLKTQSKEKISQHLQYSGSQNLSATDPINSQIVNEQDEEYQDSKVQSKNITINSPGLNIEQNLQQNEKVLEVNKGLANQFQRKHQSQSRFQNKSSLLSTGTEKYDMSKHFGILNDLNRSDVAFGQKQQQNMFKNSVQSYNFKKNQILENIKSKQYWPESIKKPEDYREFYWSKDMSFS
eukprot:403360396